MGRPSDARKPLIEAARSVMFAHNYEDVSVDELCLAAGVMLLAKGRNDPTLLHALRTGALSLTQYQRERVR